MSKRHAWQLALMFALLVPATARASEADLTMLSAGAVKSALTDVIAVHEKNSGIRVKAEFAPVGALVKRLQEGAKPDIVVLSAEGMSDAEKNGWVVAGSSVEAGRVGVGFAVNEKAAAPDISTPEAFKSALLASKSIVMINPATGTSGKHLAQVFETLGIAEALKPKTTYLEGGYVVELVGRGEIEVGLHQITEILPVQGVKLVGPLPASLQKITIYMGAVGKTAARPDDAARFLALLRTPETRALFASKGFMTAQ